MGTDAVVVKIKVVRAMKKVQRLESLHTNAVEKWILRFCKTMFRPIMRGSHPR